MLNVILCVSAYNLRKIKLKQGISKPNQQATTLLLLTDKYPDNFERLNAL